ncbi:site-specific integrase [Nicoliella lavandulae]|uniref:Site-specific integrase n=1 Tax=Nicoliella lavandulae TaxID=3082954 RepID=A0ABU8SJ88_9LACO
MATIKQYLTKDGSKRYKFQLYLGVDLQTGKQKQTTRRGFKTKKEASLELSRLQLEIAQGGIKQENNIKFEDVYKQWYQAYINTVRESTYARTGGMFKNHILVTFGDKRIRTIKINDVQKAVNQWFKIAPATFTKWYHYTSMVFDYAIKEGYIDNTASANPCKLISIPKKQDEKGDKFANFWNKQQLARFFKCIDPNKELEKFTLFRVLAFAGLRRGECLALTWDDINFSENTIRVNKTLTQGLRGKQIVQAPKTKKGRRTIILDSSTINYLKRWRTAQKQRYLMLGFNTFKKSQLVFATTTNTHKCLNTPAKWLNLIIKENGLTKITVHGFRHTHASALFASGASIKEVQERLGHEDVQTTMNVYTHVTKQQNKDAVNKLVNYLDF